MVCKIIGGIVFCAGVFLWCGNVFGFFPTFPLVGYLTAAAGVMIFKKGGCGSAGEPAQACCPHEEAGPPAQEDKSAA